MHVGTTQVPGDFLLAAKEWHKGAARSGAIAENSAPATQNSPTAVSTDRESSQKINMAAKKEDSTESPPFGKRPMTEEKGNFVP